MSSVLLMPCVTSCTIGTKTYGWKSAPVSADAGPRRGRQSYGVWGSDAIGNTGSPTSFSVTVDNSAPTVTASAIVTSATTGVGWVAQGGTYVVYALGHRRRIAGHRHELRDRVGRVDHHSA